MPATIITPISIAESGAALTLAASTATQGDKFLNSNDRGRIFLAVANASGGSITYAVAAVTTSASKRGFGALTKSNISVTIADGATKLIGPFDECFEDSAGYVTGIPSSATSVTVAAVKLPLLTQ